MHILPDVIFRPKRKKVSAGGTYEYLYSDYVPLGMMGKVESAVAFNDTGESQRIRYFIEQNNDIFWLTEFKSVGTDDFRELEGFRHLIEGERLGVRFEGTTSSDELVFHCSISCFKMPKVKANE